MTTATHAYLTDSILAMPRERLLVRIYDTLLLRISEAEAFLEQGDRARAGRAISKAYDIITTLRDALDRTVEAECVPRLDQLYRTVGAWLLEANLTQSRPLLESSRRVVAILKEGWDGAVRASS